MSKASEGFLSAFVTMICLDLELVPRKKSFGGLWPGLWVRSSLMGWTRWLLLAGYLNKPIKTRPKLLKKGKKNNGRVTVRILKCLGK
ncbi:hypothetical protein DVH24_019563 [Malus domestica]|uniref:Uncharacterized protein n=1 Tax=Malus domestica TaxID=3750 RepID=A0A498I3M9_MALDO|nr:hypothetical protein DVH24_019563 [Malus domestica]